MRIHSSTLKWEHFAFPLRWFSAQFHCQTSLLAVPSLRLEVFNTWFSISKVAACFLTSGRTWATNLRHWSGLRPIIGTGCYNEVNLIPHVQSKPAHCCRVIWWLSVTIYTQLLINNIYYIIKMLLQRGMVLLFKAYLYFCFLDSMPNKILTEEYQIPGWDPFSHLLSNGLYTLAQTDYFRLCTKFWFP